MAYNFKRLAEVDSATDIQASDSFLIEQNGQVKKANLTNTEEIMEVPETAKTLVEVDGVIKRAPFSSGGGGNANLEDMCFELDCTANTYSLNFNDISQIQKVLDNHMSVTVVFSYVTCGTNYVCAAKYASLVDTLDTSVVSSGEILAKSKAAFYTRDYVMLEFHVDINQSDYASDKFTAVSSYISGLPSGYTLLRVYASIF